jgi:ABC-type nitrate/sulfonate/bicarbonate transport system substrate-binding protein
VQTRARVLAPWVLLLSLAGLSPGAPSPASVASAAADATGLPHLRVTVFAPPSYSVWFPTLIQKTGLDVKHGFKLDVVAKPGQVAYTEFASGADKVCYCAAPAAVARFVEHGSDITLLWNVFDLRYDIATADPAIRRPKDLEGKTFSADTGTGGWAITALLLKQNGVDLSKVQIHSAWSGSQAAELAVGRVDAAMLGPVDVAQLQTRTPRTFHAFSIFDNAQWQKYATTPHPGIPSIAMGVWRDWLAVPANRDLVERLYAANQDAVAFAREHPQQAADLISQAAHVDREALLYGLTHYADIIDVRPISEYRQAIKVLTQSLLPEAKLLDRPMTDAELAAYVSDFGVNDGTTARRD